MDAIRQFIDVKDHTFQVTLPDSFNARRVEVIILPSEAEVDIPQWQKEVLDARLADLNNPDKMKSIEHLFDVLDEEI
jgi:non-ribosomal peptide synthetase component E (peptide arylation enzyme)